jgi:hypothetical protein
MTTEDDEEMTRVARPFEAAFARESAATDTGHLVDELSNMLHHVYRLGELTQRRLGLDTASFNARIFADAPGVAGCLWIRCYDTHDIAVVAGAQDVFSDYFTELNVVLVWQPLAAMPFTKADEAGRSSDYEKHLAGKPVLDTIRKAFDGLVALL